ncbi:carbohydrate ABC transporter permease [Acutalibacter muris]|uniref:Carbohydrate ABC transporter permease n=1 Tax=Acutalibacter muris TaxID=1796620 RepID=A0A1Z2XWA7_9FIRM|nr:carbohydrate ABC transporter permease [Acutalibacter muris]ANU56134.1 sugar ABC transporter permease [Hungateiclostridiaceae bacterium KB18]ASB42738.1 carbohydrate ABC transporter permease [Acutalibacter muris]QQR31946.1 carbohydrate ABC transporter permease [Acutalibacter muris]
MSNGRRAYQIVINIILILVALVMILPLVLLFMSSITDENILITNGYSFFPEKFSLYAYRYILQNYMTIFRAYGITILATLIGTTGSIVLVTMLAYPLSLKELPGKRFFNFYVLFTMLFNGGLVPSYIMWTNNFHIKNTIWAYIFPNLLLGAFNIILARTYFKSSIPEDIYEAAKIDGASYMKIYWKMVLPLGKPIIVTVGLFTGLHYWNDWTNGLYYINKSEMLSIQALLNRMILDIQALNANAGSASGTDVLAIPQVSIRMAISFVAVLPILMVFPFLQKYFASGIMLGAVKG